MSVSSCLPEVPFEAEACRILRQEPALPPGTARKRGVLSRLHARNSGAEPFPFFSILSGREGRVRGARSGRCLRVFCAELAPTSRDTDALLEDPLQACKALPDTAGRSCRIRRHRIPGIFVTRMAPLFSFCMRMTRKALSSYFTGVAAAAPAAFVCDGTSNVFSDGGTHARNLPSGKKDLQAFFPEAYMRCRQRLRWRGASVEDGGRAWSFPPLCTPSGDMTGNRLQYAGAFVGEASRQKNDGPEGRALPFQVS